MISIISCLFDHVIAWKSFSNYHTFSCTFTTLLDWNASYSTLLQLHFLIHLRWSSLRWFSHHQFIPPHRFSICFAANPIRFITLAVTIHENSHQSSLISIKPLQLSASPSWSLYEKSQTFSQPFLSSFWTTDPLLWIYSSIRRISHLKSELPS